MLDFELDCPRGYEVWRRGPHDLFEHAPDAILIFDDALTYVDANPRACEVLRCSREEIKGRHLDALFVEKDAVSRRIRTAGGEPLRENHLTVALPEGEALYVEFAVRRNVLPGIHVLFLHDVTDQHQMQCELEHHTRLETIGKVAGGVAHDFNNMITAILSYTDLQIQRAPQDETIRRYALGIQAAAERAAETAQQLLTFCRRHTTQASEVDVNAVLREAVTFVGRLIGEDIQLVLELDPDLPNVLADPGQLSQVIVNLAVNARDAMPKGGKLLLGTAKRGPAHGRERRARESCGNTHVAIFVHDTGSGISAEVLPHIFDPFFTTKPQGKGTGLGLATAYRIVQQCGGQILVSSEPNRGTTFEIVLPACGFPLPDGPEMAAMQAAPLEEHGQILD